jgi:AraC-like DNA-binding protein
MLTQAATFDLTAQTEPSTEASLAATLAGLVADAAQAMEGDLATARRLLDQVLQLLQSGASRDGLSPRRRAGPSLAPWRAKRVAAYIDEHLATSLPLSDLARVAQLSDSHFSRAFKGAFGQTPHAFITHRRIERARSEMLQSKEPLSQIALKCGFADQAHLARVFRRATGWPPGAWRRATRREAA